MKYRVSGADSQTGEDLELTLEADDEASARQKAQKRGMLIAECRPLAEQPRSAAAEAETLQCPDCGQTKPLTDMDTSGVCRTCVKAQVRQQQEQRPVTTTAVTRPSGSRTGKRIAIVAAVIVGLAVAALMVVKLIGSENKELVRELTPLANQLAKAQASHPPKLGMATMDEIIKSEMIQGFVRDTQPLDELKRSCTASLKVKGYDANSGSILRLTSAADYYGMAALAYTQALRDRSETRMREAEKHCQTADNYVEEGLKMLHEGE